MHRDLKPENILYRTKEEHSGLVIADFGMCVGVLGRPRRRAVC